MLEIFYHSQDIWKQLFGLTPEDPNESFKRKKRKMHIIETFIFNNKFQNIACF